MESYRFVVVGKVQHVYYRKFVSQSLMKMQIQGFIRNLPDGTVEIIARIYDDDYDKVLKAIREGSPMSSVENIQKEIVEKDNIIYDGFEIRY